jgi:hypothetical protein
MEPVIDGISSLRILSVAALRDELLEKHKGDADAAVDDVLTWGTDSKSKVMEAIGGAALAFIPVAGGSAALTRQFWTQMRSVALVSALVGSMSALTTFICVLCTLHTQISQSIYNTTHCSTDTTCRRKTCSVRCYTA